MKRMNRESRKQLRRERAQERQQRHDSKSLEEKLSRCKEGSREYKRLKAVKSEKLLVSFIP